MSKWTKKQKLSICWLQETCFKYNGTGRLKVKEWEKISYAHTRHKISWTSRIILARVDFGTRNITTDTEDDFKMIKD